MARLTETRRFQLTLSEAEWARMATWIEGGVLAEGLDTLTDADVDLLQAVDCWPAAAADEPPDEADGDQWAADDGAEAPPAEAPAPTGIRRFWVRRAAGE